MDKDLNKHLSKSDFLNIYYLKLKTSNSLNLNRAIKLANICLEQEVEFPQDLNVSLISACGPKISKEKLLNFLQAEFYLKKGSIFLISPFSGANEQLASEALNRNLGKIILVFPQSSLKDLSSDQLISKPFFYKLLQKASDKFYFSQNLSIEDFNKRLIKVSKTIS